MVWSVSPNYLGQVCKCHATMQSMAGTFSKGLVSLIQQKQRVPGPTKDQLVNGLHTTTVLIHTEARSCHGIEWSENIWCPSLNYLAATTYLSGDYHINYQVATKLNNASPCGNKWQPVAMTLNHLVYNLISGCQIIYVAAAR